MKTKSKIKILLADDHLVVRMGIASLLSFEPDFEVVGQADSGTAALSMAQTLNPDIVIMDLMMPDMDGVEATRRIHVVRPDIRILVLTSFGTSVEVHRAIEAGATGALVKTSTQDEICSAIRQVFNGQCVLSPEIKNTIKCADDDAMISEQQKEILRLVANGYCLHAGGGRVNCPRPRTDFDSRRPPAMTGTLGSATFRAFNDMFIRDYQRNYSH